MKARRRVAILLGCAAPTNSYWPGGALAAVIFFLALSGLSLRGSAQAVPECSSCHGKQDLAGSVHAFLACANCHTKIKAFPHPAKRDQVDCSGCHVKASVAVGESVHFQPAPPGKSPSCADCHGTHDIKPAKVLSPTTCQNCHKEPFTKYKDSVHGRARLKGEIGPATCADCHEGHRIFKKDDPRSSVYHLNLPRTCARCHADPVLVKRFNIPIANVYQLYLDSIHGRAITRSGLLVAANCSDCHGAHDIKTRTEKDSSVFRDNIHRTCGKCHAGIDAVYVESVHGKAVSKGNGVAPVCTDCHTAHQIARTEVEGWKLDIIRECGTCHQSRLTTYRDTYHGKVTSLGYTRVARCSDCHGSHDILPASNPKSRLSSANILTTCQRCHPGMGPKFARYLPHANYKDRARYPSLYYAYIFMTTLLVGVFGFFGIHLGLWLFRHGWDWKKRKWKRKPPKKDITSD